jgi:hypothetical protein
MDRIQSIVDSARGDIDPDLLTKSLSGGAKSGFLIAPAINYIPPTESIQYVFHNKHSATTVIDNGDRKTINSDRGWTIVVITDHRLYLLMVVDGTDSKTIAPLFELQTVEARTGIFKNKLIFETAVYEYHVPVQSDDDVEAAVEYIMARTTSQPPSAGVTNIWTVPLLHTVDPLTFETILSDLWEVKGYSTSTTAKSQDQGIDIIAEKGDETVLIQAKRYAPENTVGIGTVQRTAGLLSDAEFDPSRVVVATTSNFTRNAIARANNIENLELLAGPEVVQELQNSDIYPDTYGIVDPKAKAERKAEREDIEKTLESMKDNPL